MKNNFIESLFSDKAGYYLVQTKSISNSINTYEGTTYVVGFQLPRKFWSKNLKEITVGDYEEIENLTVDSNISLSGLEYPPFQLGLTISNISRTMPLDGIDIWEMIELVRSKKLKNHYNDITQWCYEQKNNSTTPGTAILEKKKEEK